MQEVAVKLRQVIRGEDEGKLLLDAIPSLRKIIGGDYYATSASTNVTSTNDTDVTLWGDNNGHHHDHSKYIHRSKHSCDACKDVILEHEEESEMLDGFETRSHRFNYLIKQFVSVISSIGDPIVCLIDDIQVSVL